MDVNYTCERESKHQLQNPIEPSKKRELRGKIRLLGDLRVIRVKVDEKRVIWKHSISFEVSVYGFFICHVHNQWVCQNETSSGAFYVYFQLAFIILLIIF